MKHPGMRAAMRPKGGSCRLVEGVSVAALNGFAAHQGRPVRMELGCDRFTGSGEGGGGAHLKVKFDGGVVAVVKDAYEGDKQVDCSDRLRIALH